MSDDTIRYVYTMRKHSEVERAHILDPDETLDGDEVQTRCGLSYRGITKYDVHETGVWDLPREACRNCKRTLDR